MPRTIATKCLQCSSLTAEEARALHGLDGDGSNCWEARRCHDRRSYYRHRHKQQDLHRRQRARELKVQLPNRAAAYLYLYGMQQSRLAPGQAMSKRRSPHSLRAELWIDGERFLATQPQHCDGMTSRQLDRYVKDMLKAFSERCGEELTGFARSFERQEQECPIHPCPLRL